MVFIASRSKQKARVGLMDIAAEIDSPVSFTSKILQKLVKSKLLVSLKGPTGGFEISKKSMDTITLLRLFRPLTGTVFIRDAGWVCGIAMRVNHVRCILNLNGYVTD